MPLVPVGSSSQNTVGSYTDFQSDSSSLAGTIICFVAIGLISVIGYLKHLMKTKDFCKTKPIAPEPPTFLEQAEGKEIERNCFVKFFNFKSKDKRTHLVSLGDQLPTYQEAVSFEIVLPNEKSVSAKPLSVPAKPLEPIPRFSPQSSRSNSYTDTRHDSLSLSDDPVKDKAAYREKMKPNISLDFGAIAVANKARADKIKRARSIRV